jgi:hypothetical protein
VDVGENCGVYFKQEDIRIGKLSVAEERMGKEDKT